jgi:5S rRNA maturation endonuclease (ribonuclease M5)
MFKNCNRCKSSKEIKEFYLEVKNCDGCRVEMNEKRKENKKKEVDKVKKLERAFCKLSEEEQEQFKKTIGSIFE